MFILYKKEVIVMHNESMELVVLEEGSESGAVQACCTSGSAAVR